MRPGENKSNPIKGFFIYTVLSTKLSQHDFKYADSSRWWRFVEQYPQPPWPCPLRGQTSLCTKLVSNNIHHNVSHEPPAQCWTPSSERMLTSLTTASTDVAIVSMLFKHRWHRASCSAHWGLFPFRSCIYIHMFKWNRTRTWSWPNLTQTVSFWKKLTVNNSIKIVKVNRQYLSIIIPRVGWAVGASWARRTRLQQRAFPVSKLVTRRQVYLISEQVVSIESTTESIESIESISAARAGAANFERRAHTLDISHEFMAATNYSVLHVGTLLAIISDLG